MDVPARWGEIVRRPEADVPLDEAALLISAAANPSLDVSAQLSRLDGIAARAVPQSTDELCTFVFDDIGIRGDADDYDAPDNSFLDRVLDRRKGIPISLSVLLIEVGRRSGITLEAVGMPGHFLVRDPADPESLIDPFGARRLSLVECERLMQAVTGTLTPLTPEMLNTTGKRAILARMLANLDRSYERRQDRGGLRWVSELRTALPGAPLADRVQLGSRLAALGHFDSAAAVLEEAAAATTADPARAQILRQASTLRARLN